MPASCVSVMGSRNVRTPNLDALAGEGVLFEDAVCQSSICLPSRISMLSGQYVSTTKQFGFTGVCDRRMPWLPETLKAGGYVTGAVGKFHVRSVGEPRWCRGMNYSAPTLPHDEGMAKPREHTYRQYCREHGLAWPTDQMHGHDPGGCKAPSPPGVTEDTPKPFASGSESRVPIEHSLETWTTDRAREFIDRQQGSKSPWFLWVSFDRPHFPSRLPKPLFDELKPEEIELSPEPDVETMTGLPRDQFDYIQGGMTTFRYGNTGMRHVLATYYRLIEWIDSEVGRLREHLRQLGMDRNTTIVFTADHGDDAGSHGAYGKARHLWSEAVTHPPLIVRAAPVLVAGSQGGRRVTDVVELVDLFPTLCKLNGVDCPDAVEGRDHSALILGASEVSGRQMGVCEEPTRRMIRDQRWRMVFDSEDDAGCALFDLESDPACFYNRYADKSTSGERVELKRQLLAFLVQRLHGEYSQEQVEHLERGLDPEDATLPENVTLRNIDQLHCFGAGARYVSHTHDLFVPFYDAPMLLFERDGRLRTMYRTRDMAVPMDEATAEPMLDAALRETMQRVHPVSLLDEAPVSSPPAGRAEAQALIDGRRRLEE